MFTALEEIVDYMADKFEVKQGELGLGYIATYEEEMLPQYPAIRITPSPITRDVHGTHQFRNDFTVDVWVYHARMAVRHSTRSKEDLQLCTKIRHLMHADLQLGGNVVFGHFVAEIPGIHNRPKGGVVVGTRMTWSGFALETF